MNAPMRRGAWTAERVEQLKELWAGVLSASQIAEVMGATSRNSIIGKAHRLDLPRRHPVNPPKPVKRKLTQRVYPARPRKPRPMLVKAPTLPPRPIPEPIRNPTSILELGHDQCRFPLWKNDQEPKLYCGAPVVGTGSWCACCLNVVSQPVRRAA